MTWFRAQTFSQNAQYTASAAATTAATLGAPVAVGDTLALGTVVTGATTGYAPTLTDSLGNTYTKITSAQGGQLFDSANSQSMDAWYCIVTNAGTPTITYKPDTTSKAWLGLKGSHFTGSDAASIRRDSKGATQTNPGTGANLITTASIAAQAGDLLWGVSFNAATFLTEVSGTGFTTSTRDATTAMLDEWLSASGAAAATFTDGTNGGASVYMTIGIAITTAANPPVLPPRRSMVPTQRMA